MNLDVIRSTVQMSLEEDIGSGDITAALIPASVLARASIITNEAGIFCGKSWAETAYTLLDPAIEWKWAAEDGQFIVAKQVLAYVKGPARALVTGERTVLNWLQTLSGTATAAARYVEALRGTSARLLDTRKTIPGLRYAQKYAVQCGGGLNHRIGLYDKILIKENHLMAAGSMTNILQRAREKYPNFSVEIEVETLTEFQEALLQQPDLILLDDFTLPDIKKAVALNKRPCWLEVSGGVGLHNIREVAQTGVDFISVGAITKHVQALDMSMRFNL